LRLIQSSFYKFRESGTYSKVVDFLFVGDWDLLLPGVEVVPDLDTWHLHLHLIVHGNNLFLEVLEVDLQLISIPLDFFHKVVHP